MTHHTGQPTGGGRWFTSAKRQRWACVGSTVRAAPPTANENDEPG
jgi:hypothetical protein